MRYNRKHTRLKTYDYSSNGVYFVTFCTHQKRHSLSEISIRNSIVSVKLKPLGAICKEALSATKPLYPAFSIISYTIMPNHVHALIEIHAPTSDTLSDFVGEWKKKITLKARSINIADVIWQRSFYEHIVRDEEELYQILQYIKENPKKWTLDRFYTSPNDSL